MRQMSEENKQEAGKIFNVGSVSNMYVENMIVQTPATEPQIPAPVANKNYITDEKKIRYVLDDYDDEEEFEFYPDRLYVLSLYFITLTDKQEHYAVFDYVSYAPIVKDGRVNDDIWSVPYTITPIDLRGRKVRKVKEIKSVYAEALPSLTDTLSVLESALFYNLGIVFKKVEKGREYIEYKQSTTEPDKMRCNYVREFFVHDIDSTGALNLADPECLHQHRYLPFSVLDQLPHSGGLFRFMDKPIPDNVMDVLLYEKRRLIRNSVQILRRDLVYQMEGILFIITLMNEKKLIHPTHILSTVVEQAMLYGNIGRYCVDGANVIGCVPYRKYNFTDLLCRMYEGLSKIHPELTVCCTALVCQFEYGKIFGVSARTASFALPDSFLSHDLGSSHTWEHTDQKPGILFGWDMKDSDKVKFSPKGAQVFRPNNYSEENRTMNFIEWKRDK